MGLWRGTIVPREAWIVKLVYAIRAIYGCEFVNSTRRFWGVIFATRIRYSIRVNIGRLGLLFAGPCAYNRGIDKERMWSQWPVAR
jgi:hypothetical protein